MNNVLGAFPGTNYELNLLNVAISQNCTCPHHPPEATDLLCPAHEMLRDLRVLHHLIFVYRQKSAYIAEEFDVCEA